MRKVQPSHSEIACQMGTNHAKKAINDSQRSTRVEIMNAKSMFTSRLRAAKSLENAEPSCEVSTAKCT